MEHPNGILIRRWFEQVWNEEREDAIGEMSHPDARGFGQAEHGREINMDEFRALWRGLRGAFPDIRFTIRDTISEGDRVAARWTATLTHKGNFLGFAPTGKEATITGTTTLRIAEGRIVEGWDNWDQLGLLVQIGAVPLNRFV